MSINIIIPEIRCSAGSTVTGAVSLLGEEDIDVQYITITLQARCKTKVSRSNGQSRHVYRGRAPLIHLRRELFTGPHTLHPGHSWPFTLTLPMQCDARQTDLFKQYRGPFNSDRAQSLPPAFSDSNYSLSWTAESFIRYELEASLIGSRTKIFSLGDLSATRQLDFRTFRYVETPDPQLSLRTQPIACYSLRLQPEYQDVPLTLKDKLKSMRTSKLPVAMFKVHMQLPKVGVALQSLPAFLKLEHDLERSTAPEPPTVLLKKCSIELRALTYIQCIRDEILRDGDEQRDWDTDHHLASVDFSANMTSAPPLTTDFDLRDVMSIRVPPYFPPTFSTFNIRRAYRLLLKLSVECAQKTFKAEFTTLDFLLLARDYMPTGEGDPGASSSSSYAVNDAAPAYQKEVVSPPPPSYPDAKIP